MCGARRDCHFSGVEEGASLVYFSVKHFVLSEA